MDKNLENLLEIYEKLVKVSEKIIDESKPISKNDYKEFAVPTHLLYELEEVTHLLYELEEVINN